MKYILATVIGIVAIVIGTAINNYFGSGGIGASTGIMIATAQLFVEAKDV